MKILKLLLSLTMMLCLSTVFGQKIQNTQSKTWSTEKTTSSSLSSESTSTLIKKRSTPQGSLVDNHRDGKQMTFQGTLFQNGEAFNGTSDMTFTMDLDSGYTWEETIESVNVINGLYSVVLGQTHPLPHWLFYFENERTLQVQVNGTILGSVKLYSPFESRSRLDNRVLLFDSAAIPKAEMSVWAGQGFLNLDGPDDRSNAILSGNFYENQIDNPGALNHGIMALYGPANAPGEADHLRVLAGSRGDGSSAGALPFLEMKGVDPESGELRDFVNLDVKQSQDTSGNVLATFGSLDLINSSGSGSFYRTQNIGMYNDEGITVSRFTTGSAFFINPMNTRFPAGWYGTLGNSGFIQQVGYNDDGGFLGAILSGFWNGDRPSIWLEDPEANMGAFLAIEDGAGMLQLNGQGWNPNIQMGPKNWENSNLPYMKMSGQDELEYLNDNGTPEDSSDDFTDTYVPDLIWMDIQKWEDGTEVGALTLRSTDGTEFNINPYGIQTDNLQVGNPAEGTYTQQRRDVFRVKNDNDQFSSVFLNRFGDGHSRLQVAGHNENGESTGVAYVGANQNGGYSYIGGTDATNNLRAGMYVRENLPHYFMQGTYDVQGDILEDSTGNLTDTTYYRPELVNIDLIRREDGTEFGELWLRGTDGSNFGINSYGLMAENVNARRSRSKEFELEEEFGGRVIANMRSFDTGAQLNIGGIVNDTDTTETSGGGVSLGGKFWEGTPQNGYFHLRGPVNNANYFGANIRFELEAVQDQHDNTGSEFRMYSPMLDENSSARRSLTISTVSDDGANYASQLESEGSNSPNFAIGAKTWEIDNNGSELPYFKFNGSQQTSYVNDNGTPGDSLDDFEDFYFPDLVWMDVTKINSGIEYGVMQIRSTNNEELYINPGYYEMNNSGIGLVSMDSKSYGTGINTSNGGTINLRGYSETSGVRMYGEFIDGDQNSVSHMALDDNSGSYVYLWGSGSISATGSITGSSINQTSDQRFKKEVKSIESALSKVQQLNGYTYFWNRAAEKAKGITDDSEQIGVIAQEVEAIFPQLVNTDDKGYKSVNYAAMSAVLIEAVKELNAEIEALKAENVSLKAEVSKTNALESRLAQIEKLLGVKAGNESSANNK